MSGIGNVGSTQNLLQYLQNQKSSAEISTDEALQMLSPPSDAQRQTHLDQALTAAGVDEETASAIEAELNAAFEEAQASGQFPPDRQAMKATVDKIFAKHGLDAETVLGKCAGASTPSMLDFGTSEESSQDLIELITNLAKNASSPTELSQLLTDALKGVDFSV
jgi:hypothetical protein